MDNILNRLKATQILRISCSDIAAVAGFHPWAKMDEIFEKYLYQDLDELMLQDAENLDTEFLTTEQEVQKILLKIDAEEKIALDELDSSTKDGTVLNNNAKAEDMLSQIQQLMKSKGVLDKVTSTELKFMENEFRGRVRKNYGINCENKSLDKYEEIIGFPVVDRNMEYIKLNVMPEVIKTKSMAVYGSDSIRSDDSSANASDAFSVLLDSSKRLQKEQALGIKRRRVMEKPSFMLIGRVDGISHQLDLSSEDPTQWNKVLKVVVEMKSRVRGVSSPPPLHEQIQIVSYMIILGCDCGDLVQAVARKPDRVTIAAAARTREATVVENDPTIRVTTETTTTVVSTEGGSSSLSSSNLSSSSTLTMTHVSSESGCTNGCISGCCSCVSSGSDASSGRNKDINGHGSDSSRENNNSSINGSAGASAAGTGTGTQAPFKPRPRKYDPSELYSEEDFHVSRIRLDGAPFYHRKYWDTVVMPRLRVFRDAVAVMREDDSLRWAYLLSPTDVKMKMLQNLCPYIDL